MTKIRVGIERNLETLQSLMRYTSATTIMSLKKTNLLNWNRHCPSKNAASTNCTTDLSKSRPGQVIGLMQEFKSFPVDNQNINEEANFGKASFNINRIEIDRIWRLKNRKIKISFSSTDHQLSQPRSLALLVFGHEMAGTCYRACSWWRCLSEFRTLCTVSGWRLAARRLCCCNHSNSTTRWPCGCTGWHRTKEYQEKEWKFQAGNTRQLALALGTREMFEWITLARIETKQPSPRQFISTQLQQNACDWLRLGLKTVNSPERRSVQRWTGWWGWPRKRA